MERSGKTAVVVDDELITRLDFSGMLSDLGFTVTGSAADGFDAVEICRNTRPDLVLMDISMPIFNGLSAAEKILQEGLARAVVIVSAFSDRETIRKAADLGVKGYLVKPVETNALCACVEVALAAAGREARLRDEKLAAEEALADAKIIDKAKRILAAADKISEPEAYRKIQKVAMDKRSTMRKIAESILDSTEDRFVAKAKTILREAGLSDRQAYRRIQKTAAAFDIPVEEAAAMIVRDPEQTLSEIRREKP